MGYINRRSNSELLAEATITGGVSGYVCGVPQLGGLSGYNSDLDEFYVSIMSFPQGTKYWYSENHAFHLELYGDEDEQEIVTPEVRASQYASDWNTNLKANTGKSALNISHDNISTYSIYINGELYATYTNYNQAISLFTRAQWVSSTGGAGETRTWTGAYTSTMLSDMPDLSGSLAVKRSDGASSGNATASFESDGGLITVTSNCGLDYDTGGNECGSVIGFTLSPKKEYHTSFRYSIDGSNFNEDTSRLRFRAEDTNEQYQWTGLTSQTFNYNYKEFSYNASVAISQKNDLGLTIVSQSSSPIWTVSQYNGVSGAWTHSEQTGILPTTIGNIKLLNPETVNNSYSQTAQFTDKNSIVKITPPLNFTPSNLFSFGRTDDHIIATDAWKGHNCTIPAGSRTFNISQWNVDRDCYIYITRYREHLREFETEGLPTNYRQANWQPFRYITPPLYKDGQPCSFPIELECEAYGEVTGHTWTLSDSHKITHNNKVYYDLGLCNKGEDKSSYMTQFDPEKLDLYEEGKVYYAEKPATVFGYLPNIVGNVKIRITEPGTYELKNCDGAILDSIKIFAKDEYKAPDLVGIRTPKPDHEDERPYLMNRYILGIVDGMHAFEIPQNSLEQSANYTVDIWSILSFWNISHLNTATQKIYPRSSLFDITHYEANSKGNYPIDAMGNGETALIYWLKVRNGNELISVPRFDRITGTEMTDIAKYLNDNNITVLPCVAHFGGAICGNLPQETDIRFSDSSPYTGGGALSVSSLTNGWYYENVGTVTTISNSKDNWRIDPVVDGGKYWWSRYLISDGKIWRNSLGLILRNSQGQILRGNDYD